MNDKGHRHSVEDRERMDEIWKKLSWLIVILPGFLSVAIISAIVDVGDVGEFSLTLYSLALTFFNVAIALIAASLIIWVIGLFGKACLGVCYNCLVVGLIVFAAIISGVVVGISLERGTFFAIVRQIPLVDILNKRSSVRPLIFLLRRNTGGLLATEGDARPGPRVGEAYLRVYIDKDTIYEGWPEFYDSKPTEIYLSPACRVAEGVPTDTAKKVPGPGVIIPESKINYAVFLDRASSPCFHLWFPQTVTPQQQNP